MEDAMNTPNTHGVLVHEQRSLTLGEMIAYASTEPAEVRASRARAMRRLQSRITRRQTERELVELGYRDHGGDGGGA